jgi:hypothetical protein
VKANVGLPDVFLVKDSIDVVTEMVETFRHVIYKWVRSVLLERMQIHNFEGNTGSPTFGSNAR